MPESVSLVSFLLRHPAIRYVSLSLFIVFILYQVSTYETLQTLVPTYHPSLETTPEHQYDQAEILTPTPAAAQASAVAVIPAYHEFETLPIEPPSLMQSRIAKVSSVYYEVASETSECYERALLSHRAHDAMFGYKHFVQRHRALSGKAWSKHAYMFHILVQELIKPPADRLDWLFWHDADIVLLNSRMPLEVFLPPTGEKWAHINLLVANDCGGLNDGTFFVRVSEWSLYFFAAGVSFPFYHPDVHLRYDEQTALELLLEDDKFKNNSLHVPQHWFNAFHDWGVPDDVPEEWNWRNGYVQKGTLLVHLAGTTDGGRIGLIDEWIQKSTTHPDEYAIPLNETAFPASIKDFWENEANKEYETQDAYWRHYRLLIDVGGKADDVTRKGIKGLKEKFAAEGDGSNEELEMAIKKFEQSRKEIKKDLLRDAERAILNGTREDDTHRDRRR